MGDVESVDLHELFPLLPSRVTIGDIRQAILNHEHKFNWNVRVEKKLVPDLLREILNVADGRIARQNQGGSGHSNQQFTGAGDPNSTTSKQGGAGVDNGYRGGRGGVVEQI